jgi:hypothetical protein
MEGFEAGVAIVTVLAMVLLIISILAYRRDGSRGLLLLGFVFAIFLVKGIILSLWIFTESLDNESDALFYSVLFDAIILIFLFFSGLSSPGKSEMHRSDSQQKEEDNPQD